MPLAEGSGCTRRRPTKSNSARDFAQPVLLFLEPSVHKREQDSRGILEHLAATEDALCPEQERRILRMLTGRSRWSNRMAFLKFDSRAFMGAIKSSLRPLLKALIALALFFGAAASSQAQEPQPTNTDGSSPSSSTSDTTQASMDTNPLRKSESHSTSGNRSVDTQRVEVLGTDGSYEPDYEIETETIRVNSTTTRTAVRTYKWDANGQRNLVLLTEEEARKSSGGDDQVVRMTSSR